MILFTLLIIALAILATLVALAIGVGGVALIVVFGDIIVCVWIIILIIRHLFRR